MFTYWMHCTLDFHNDYGNFYGEKIFMYEYQWLTVLVTQIARSVYKRSIVFSLNAKWYNMKSYHM